MAHKTLIFNEKVRFRNSAPIMAQLWLHPDWLEYTLDAKSIENLLYQLAFKAGGMHDWKQTAWAYSIKRRGGLLVVTWARHDKLTSDCAVYWGHSLHPFASTKAVLG